MSIDRSDWFTLPQVATLLGVTTRRAGCLTRFYGTTRFPAPTRRGTFIYQPESVKTLRDTVLSLVNSPDPAIDIYETSAMLGIRNVSAVQVLSDLECIGERPSGGGPRKLYRRTDVARAGGVTITGAA